MWTAPEFVRQEGRAVYGSQKGDVYSFAIVLYEIYGKKGPFGETHLTAKGILAPSIHSVFSYMCSGFAAEIITRVRHRYVGEKAYRPPLSALGSVPKFVTDTIEECWGEDPSSRPEFKTVQRLLKPLQKGM